MTSLAAFYTELGSLDLPMPFSTMFVESVALPFVSLSLSSVDDGQAWADHLGVGPLPVELRDDGKGRFVSFHGRTAVTVGGMRVCLSAHESLPAGGEEVVGPFEGSGSATAPTETAVGVSVASADGEPTLSGAPAADPVPDSDGDGAAVTPEVWVARRRRGIGYHQIEVGLTGGWTTCGRAARPNGLRIPQAEAEAFGAVPCDRCYGTEG